MPIWLVQPDGQHEEVIRANTPVPHEATVEFDVPAGAREVSCAVFEGLSMRSGEVEYLGTLRVGALKPGDALTCGLRFSLNAEGILKIHAAVPAMSMEQDVVLATQSAPEEVVRRW